MVAHIENYQHIKDYFQKLKFQEDIHVYTVDDDKLPSVSGLIKNYVEPFDAKAVSKYSAIKQKKTQVALLKEWEDTKVEACDRGHRVHLFGELYPWDRTLIPTCPQEIAIKKFWDELPPHIIPAFMELRMYHKLFKFAGTADILLFDTINRTFILADYKTNKDLFKNYKGKRMLYPFTNMLDCPFSKYTLQLSYYQMLFEQTGCKISDRRIIWLDIKTAEYTMYKTQDVRNILNNELLTRN